ncbi:hypothetical protein ZWY2020_019288 [Hordeum vulgare]|nr:hypothetical protein ZWY2020_019288 [Hordeum vulgare]
MREWMAYHAHFFGPRSHFVFHDAGGVSPEAEFGNYYYNQFLVVNDCLHWYRHAANWTFFFDVDEYLYLPDGQALDQVLAKLSGYTQFTFEQNPMSTKLCVKNPRNGYSREWGFEKFVFRNSITRVRRDRKYAIQARNAYATGVHMSQNVYGRSAHKTETLIRICIRAHMLVMPVGRAAAGQEDVPCVPHGQGVRLSKGHLCRTRAAEVPHVGALQKLLLPLQVGYDGVTKDRDSEVLKLLNGFRGSVGSYSTAASVPTAAAVRRSAGPPPPSAGPPARVGGCQPTSYSFRHCGYAALGRRAERRPPAAAAAAASCFSRAPLLLAPASCCSWALAGWLAAVHHCFCCSAIAVLLKVVKKLICSQWYGLQAHRRGFLLLRVIIGFDVELQMAAEGPQYTLAVMNFDDAVKQLIDLVHHGDDATEDKIKAFLFHGWFGEGLGASAVLRATAEHLKSNRSDPDMKVQFGKVLHVDCSLWKNRRTMQREIAAELNLGHLMPIFDKQDEDDDFKGVEDSSRAEITSIAKLLDLSGNTCMASLPAMSSAASLKMLVLDGCANLETVTLEGALPLLETFSFDGYGPTENWEHPIKLPKKEFRLKSRATPIKEAKVTKISLAGCGRLQSIFLRALANLDELNLSEIESGITFKSLKHIKLYHLHRLERICEARLTAPALETISLRDCWGLRRIPAVDVCQGPMPVVDCEKDWWGRLEWDGLDAGHHPSLFKTFHSAYYKEALPRVSVLR